MTETKIYSYKRGYVTKAGEIKHYTQNIKHNNKKRRLSEDERDKIHTEIDRVTASHENIKMRTADIHAIVKAIIPEATLWHVRDYLGRTNYFNTRRPTKDL